MPKKPARNAFYFYMKELEPSLRKEGRVFINGMADVVPVAHPRWKALSENEKERFENMAKEYKAKMRGVEGDKYKMDNVGNIISQRKNPHQENDKRRQKERREVVAKWTGKDVTEEKFYFINFQILCKTESNDYLPCELAVIEFSLSKGITKKFHKFIEPGQIPTGYRFVCMNTSEETHQIPIQDFEKSDSNYTGICIQLQNFINPNQELPENPPFYCLSQSRDMTKYCLEWINERSRMGHASGLRKVYALEDLLMDLYVHGDGPKISQSGCLDQLTSHHWDYISNTRCDFHEELECKHCSLAIAQRYAYAIADSLAVIYKIKLTDKHLPSTAEEEPCVVLPPTVISTSRRSYDYPRTNQPQAGRGRGQKRADVSTFAPSSVVDDDDLDSLMDDGMNTSLRRPNVTGMAFTGNVWNNNTYAGGAVAPDATSAPKPPAAWQNGITTNMDEIFGRSSIPLQQETSVKPTLNGGDFPRLPQPSIRPLMRPLGPQSAPPQNPAFAMRGVSMPGRMPTSLGMAGRGSNINMGSSNVRPPVGRGYAPPGMIRVQNQMKNIHIEDSDST